MCKVQILRKKNPSSLNTNFSLSHIEYVQQKVLNTGEETRTKDLDFPRLGSPISFIYFCLDTNIWILKYVSKYTYIHKHKLHNLCFTINKPNKYLFNFILNNVK